MGRSFNINLGRSREEEEEEGCDAWNSFNSIRIDRWIDKRRQIRRGFFFAQLKATVFPPAKDIISISQDAIIPWRAPHGTIQLQLRALKYFCTVRFIPSSYFLSLSQNCLHGIKWFPSLIFLPNENCTLLNGPNYQIPPIYSPPRQLFKWATWIIGKAILMLLKDILPASKRGTNWSKNTCTSMHFSDQIRPFRDGWVNFDPSRGSLEMMKQFFPAYTRTYVHTCGFMQIQTHTWSILFEIQCHKINLKLPPWQYEWMNDWLNTGFDCSHLS